MCLVALGYFGVLCQKKWEAVTCARMVAFDYDVSTGSGQFSEA